MKNDCSVCDGLEMIVTGTYMWILGEDIIEEDKWETCPVCTGERNGNNTCKNMSNSR